MYFSKNSRYVLQKAQWFTPPSCLFTCLKGNEKSLSIKYPKDDPTKPPLRRNIPTDSPVEYYFNAIPETQRRDLSEQRSKNFISKTANSSPAIFDDGLLPRSESEIQLPKFTPEQYFKAENPEKDSDANVTDPSYELPFLPADEVIGEILVSGKTESPEKTDVSLEKEKKQTSNKSDAPKTEIHRKEASGGERSSDLESSDHRIVHIIIDFPQKIDENLNLEFLKSKDNAARKFSNNVVKRVSVRESKEHVAQKPNLSQPKKWRSRSLMNFNTKPNKKRFEVHEIEDSGTYVLHLKFKNVGGVETVPEKEVKTRNATTPDFSMRANSPVKISLKPPREIIAVDDTQEIIKYREKRKKPKFSKREMKPKLNSLPQINSEISENVQASEFLDWQQPQYYELPVSDSFEEKKTLLPFKKNEYGMKNIPSSRMPVPETPEVKEVELEEKPTENMSAGDEARTEMESAVELREAVKEEGRKEAAAEREELLAEPVAEEQEREKEIVEAESSPQVQDEEFVISNYKDRHEHVEKPKLAAEDTRPPPTDWMVPSFMGSAAERPKEIGTVASEKSRPKKKFKNSASISKKGKGKTKKKTYGPGSKNARPQRPSCDVTDFKSGASSVPIKCDKPTYAMKLSAAYPPLLNEAMKRRYYRYRSNSVYNFEPGVKLQSKPLEMNPKAVEVIPIKISKSNEGSDFVRCQGERASKTTSVPKISDNICNIANENITQNKGVASLDSLAMMKKVKEIVDLDLNNAIKIFKPHSVEVISSVVINKGMGKWILDEKELRKRLAIQKSEFLNDIKKAESTRDFFGDVELNPPKYLPTTKEGQTEMKLDHSVVILNPDTNKFTVDVEDLQEAVKRRTEESFDDVVVEKLEGLLTGTKSEPILVFSAADNAKMMSKSGDSILVFDEKTQKWKVDYSILEKREKQMRVEEELTKRSEFILETIEKLEKDNMPAVPKPETRDRKTFDYNKEQWKDYGPEKKTKNTKSPFKESDAKEIRKKNSDLYEDLFVKKDKIKKSDGVQSAEMKLSKKTSATESGTTKETPGTSNKPEPEPKPKIQEKESPVPLDQKIEDDNYWEAFLNMKIPPRSEKKIQDVTETKKPKIRAPGPPPPPPSTPPTSPTPPVSSPPGPKIEEPKLKIQIPLTDEVQKKNTVKDIPPLKPQPKEKKPKSPVSPGVTEKPKLKSPVPPSKTEKQKESKVTVPPPTKPTATKKEEPKAKPPTPPPSPLPPPPTKPTATKKEEPKAKPPTPPPSPLPPPPKKEAPKSKPPPTEKKEERKEKLNPSKKKEKDVPSSASLTKKSPKADKKKEPKVKAPSSSSIKSKEDPKTGGKKDKAAADHYISKNIVELSRNSKDKNSKMKSNKIETVKLNITADRRLPSKVMEINLNKKFDKPKESTDVSKNEKKGEKGADNRIFYKKFEKYKSPFSDLEYEEKSMKIKSDIASNPNLKKLGNWSKTLVLHDIAKPPENIESWLKDETDKMATLLLKVLQEATDGKPRRKSSRPKLTDKGHNKANPYDNIRKKQETTNHEGFLFKVRPVNASPESDKKKANQAKTIREIDDIRNLPIQPVKPEKMLEVQAPGAKKENLMKTASQFVSIVPEGRSSTSLETMDPLMSRDFLQQCRLANEITDDIPGPEIMKRISNTWRVFPIFSVQMTIFTLLRLFQLVNLGKSFLDNSNPEKSRRHAFGKLFSKYGPIVNVQGPLSGSVILIYKPEHLSAVFEQDASIPVRSVFDSLEQSRRDAEDKHLPVGMYTEWNTSQWAELKKNTNDPLIKGRDKFFATVEAAGDSLIGNIRKNKNQQNFASEDFMDQIKRWSLEGLCSVLFEKSFGFLEGKTKNMSWILGPDKLYMSIDEATSYLSKCERGFQTWRLMTTPSAAGLKQSYRTLSGIVAKQIYQAEANLKNKNELLKNNKMQMTKDLTFLESMLLNDGMTPEEITCNLIDIMLIGTNAMSSALGFLLYDLAQNVKVQNRLLNEVRDVLPSKSSRLEYRKFNSLKYLQACLKESLRLHMPVPIFFRMLQNDILLSNYIVPKGTYVVMDYRVSCMREQIFDEPEKFQPERWLEDEKWIQNFHPFTTLPLCHGPRAELAKRVVEMQILACVAKIIRNFQVEYQFGEIQATDNIIAFPDKPLKFNFVERDI